MILVLASDRDPGAAALVAGWAGARLLTPSDLSLPGWVLTAGPRVGDPVAGGRGVADGEPFESDHVECLVSLLAGVDAADLGWIGEDHREYVASEMTAFLGHWMTTLGERCLVAPSYASLAGPCPPAAVWAAAAGMKLAAGDPRGGGRRTVATVVGDQVHPLVAGGTAVPREDGAVVAATAHRLRRMAAAFDAPLLTVVLQSDEVDPGRTTLRAVLPAPMLPSAEARDAVRNLVEGRRSAVRRDEQVAS